MLHMNVEKPEVGSTVLTGSLTRQVRLSLISLKLLINLHSLLD